MARAWAAPVTKDSDPSSEWFTKRTTDPKTGKDTLEWAGPEIANSVMLTGHAACWKELAQLGRLGTSNTNGEAFKASSGGMTNRLL